MAERVRFLGTRCDVPDLLEAADVTVLTSDWEGMPIAVLESLAAGKPVVASDVDGVREALAGGGGKLVSRRDPVGDRRGTRRVPVRRGRPCRGGAAGRAAVERDHDPHTFMKSYDELLRTVAGGTSVKKSVRTVLEATAAATGRRRASCSP